MKSAGKVVGFVKIRVICADIPGLLEDATGTGIVMQSLKQTDQLTVEAIIRRNDYFLLRKCVRRWGGEINILSASICRLVVKRAVCRPILLFVSACLVLLSLWLPSRVLFVEIEGNIKIPSGMLREAAQNCGIYFGASRRQVRSEYVKNRLLETVPELQWAGINTYGCRAVVAVKERAAPAENSANRSVGSIVAVRDGVIESCTATRGNLLCRPGQAVKKGEVLISGYTDCGITIRATEAEGEVFAKTFRQMTVIVPTNFVLKLDRKPNSHRISILIGKKRINLLKDSGIYSTSCVKMYREYPLTLPGGLILPVALSIEQPQSMPGGNEGTYTLDGEEIAAAFAEEYLRSHMVSGVILDCSGEITDNGDTIVYRGQYLCSEMIGRVQNEGITNTNG